MHFKWKIAQAAEVRWWQNYLKRKDKSEYYTWKQNYWRSFLDDINFSLKAEKLRILDAGSGPAGIFTILDQHEVVAVDPLLDKYQSQLAQFDTSDYPFTNFITAPLEQIDITSSFDVVFCLNCINHVGSIPESISKLYASMKAGGQLVISTDAHNHSALKKIFQLLPGDILHPHQYDIAEYESFLVDAGFEIQKSQKVSTERIFSYWVIQAIKPK